MKTNVKLIQLINENNIRATIRLFKSVLIFEKKGQYLDEKSLRKLIDKGFLLSPEVVFNYRNDLDFLIEKISDQFGLNGEQLNATFHKQWNIVKNSKIEELVFAQIIHYISTYGFQDLGIYDDATIFIPNEELNIPNIDVEGFNFVLIKGYTKKELKEKIFEILHSGIALGKESIDDIIEIAKIIDIQDKDIEQIKNKEVRIILYDHLNILPQNPTEFLRFCIYKTTNTTLLIKSRELFSEINEKDNSMINPLFSSYDDKYGFKQLAEVFNRFKPIFLAFKTNDTLKNYINIIRKLSKKYHKPLKADYLNSVTQLISRNSLNIERLISELEKVNVFRKIRLLYALKFRTSDAKSILYRIRNGKGYAKKFSFKEKKRADEISSIIITSICNDIKNKVYGKRIYIPENVYYSLPSTEKQFIGNIPSGSYISIKDNLVAGIHWENVERQIIDLDLSIINVKTGKIGWNTSYRTDGREILFSGDITSAPRPNGATELLFISTKNQNEFIMFVNYYNFKAELEVPFKVIVGQKENTEGDFMIDPNNAKAIALTRINTKQKILGFIISLPNECRFYFIESNIGNSNISSQTEYMKDSLEYLTNFFKDTISLREILEMSGGIIVSSKEDCDIDLSIKNLEKDTIIELFY